MSMTYMRMRGRACVYHRSLLAGTWDARMHARVGVLRQPTVRARHLAPDHSRHGADAVARRVCAPTEWSARCDLDSDRVLLGMLFPERVLIRRVCLFVWGHREFDRPAWCFTSWVACGRGQVPDVCPAPPGNYDRRPRALRLSWRCASMRCRAYGIYIWAQTACYPSEPALCLGQGGECQVRPCRSQPAVSGIRGRPQGRDRH